MLDLKKVVKQKHEFWDINKSPIANNIIWNIKILDNYIDICFARPSILIITFNSL